MSFISTFAIHSVLRPTVQHPAGVSKLFVSFVRNKKKILHVTRPTFILNFCKSSPKNLNPNLFRAHESSNVPGRPGQSPPNLNCFVKNLKAKKKIKIKTYKTVSRYYKNKCKRKIIIYSKRMDYYEGSLAKC